MVASLPAGTAMVSSFAVGVVAVKLPMSNKVKLILGHPSIPIIRMTIIANVTPPPPPPTLGTYFQTLDFIVIHRGVRFLME